jgi:hypothetical protein
MQRIARNFKLISMSQTLSAQPDRMKLTSPFMEGLMLYLYFLFLIQKS